MRILCLVPLLAVLLAASGWCRPVRPAGAVVSQEFENVELVEVVKVLAKSMGRRVYIGPGVEGRVSVRFCSVPAEVALAMLLEEQPVPIGYKLVPPRGLVVASPQKLEQIDSEIIGCRPGGRKAVAAHSSVIRTEFLLEHAIVQLLLPELRSDFPSVEFLPHLGNGFYAVGVRGDLARLESKLPQLDVAPSGLAEDSYRVEHGSVEDIRVLVEISFPTLWIQIDSADSSTLRLRGFPHDVEGGTELIEELDKPPEK
ncbi:hypothetical protein ABS71_11245 [bacterium SCN 62-11]|nr:hypothetical protein [Candidatus Eremiobacteraeota bacterium]ODT67222.1 MAG: hypothetical protein ABS71_11245 [bacterium SCN 62-11]